MTIVSDVLSMLEDDIVSYGLLAQLVRQDDAQVLPKDQAIDSILRELLSMGVEIGETKLLSSDYVEFYSWAGTIDERAARAAKIVECSKEADREFSYWLCLRENVDKFEGSS